MRKVLITGAFGQLGSCMLRSFASDEEFVWVGLSKEELDITDASKVAEVLANENPFAVVNAAAYTAVDRAEEEEAAAIKINVEGVETLAKACETQGITLVHISTDYVFSGDDGGTENNPYSPNDTCSPCGVYGRTKREGELALLASMSSTPHYIIRTGWLYDSEGTNFFNKMRKLATQESINVVDDQVGTPTWAGSLALSIRALLKSDLNSGIYHFSDKGCVSWFGFAKEIFSQLGLSPNLNAISSTNYPTAAKRPANSHLGGEEFSSSLGVERLNWKQSLAQCVGEFVLWERVKNIAEEWTHEPFDEEIRSTVSTWLEEDNRDELIECFHMEMEFGTGGMRGKCAPGTNRINTATIAMATQGLCNYLKSKESELPSPLKVTIAYDSRLQSPLLSRITAEVLSGNGIEALIYPELRPTPQLSFTVSHLECSAGIVITASHNPPEYNGYKVYYSDGAQITAPHDQAIINEVRKVKSLGDVKRSTDNVVELGTELDVAYRKKILTLKRSSSLSEGSEVKLVYTGLHGTGALSVPQALREFGFENVYEVKSQAVPDGNFPTVKSPNPEEGEALSEAIALGESINADLVMGTDPDADRVGIAVPGPDGKMVLLNGNETGALLCDYVLCNGREDGSKFDAQNFIASTVVTTPLLLKLADFYGVGHRETLTGFKHIAAAISHDARTYVVGGEESYGYLIGDTAMDKDGVSSCCVLAEMAHELKKQGTTILQKLEQIHREHGVYQEGLVSVVKEGRDGAAQIAKMMDDFRNNAPTQINGEEIVSTRDFSDGTQPLFPKSNVLQFITEKGSRITVRPSGTEPKIKFYVSVNHVMKEGEDYGSIRQQLKQRVQDLFVSFGA